MLKVREVKALARQTLIGRYTTLILAGIVAAVLVFLSSAAMFGGFAAALNWSGALAGPDGNGYSIIQPGINLHIYSDAAPSMPLMIAGVVVFTIFLIITLILLIWFSIGKRKLMLNICRGDRYGVGDLFYGFSAEAHPFRVIFASIARFLIHNLVGLIALGLFLGSSRILRDMPDASYELKKWLPIVILVIMALIQLNIDIGYTFAELSIIDRPETRVGEALKHSREVTKGRKLKLIWMALFSFIFWYLLISVCRFTALWILPYIRAAYTVLYLDGDGSAWQLPPNRPSYKASQYPQKPEVKETAVKAEERRRPHFLRHRRHPKPKRNLQLKQKQSPLSKPRIRFIWMIRSTAPRLRQRFLQKPCLHLSPHRKQCLHRARTAALLPASPLFRTSSGEKRRRPLSSGSRKLIRTFLTRRKRKQWRKADEMPLLQF